MIWTLIATAMTAASVVALLFSGVRPPIGTPAAMTREGNSAPARTLVDGLGKSERTGERWEAK